MRPRHLGILLVSAATLLYELTLMRLYAVAQWHHYAFLSVSVALLGNALSGTVTALLVERMRRALDGWGHRVAAGAAGRLSGAGAPAVRRHLLAWDARQLLYLLLNWALLVLPFALSGYQLLQAIGASGERGHVGYGANLVGAALGSALLLALLPLVGPRAPCWWRPCWRRWAARWRRWGPWRPPRAGVVARRRARWPWAWRARRCWPGGRGGWR